MIGKMEVAGFWMSLYNYAWFIGFAVAFIVYYIAMALTRKGDAA